MIYHDLPALVMICDDVMLVALTSGLQQLAADWQSN